jgi:hypothetical protein
MKALASNLLFVIQEAGEYHACPNFFAHLNFEV